ncbi:alanine--glyoxylate aminotransferase-like [Euwallacea similis]|uniref:alanine--glyoxylate aminotransferase-like n=1 Tax=Euwallacea similis TaxID=1736056 RepID=UPI00344C06E7
MEIAPPPELKKLLAIPHKLLMGPGPSNSSPRILQALCQPVLGHMDPEVFQIMDEIKKGLQYMFQTRNKLTLCVSASGHAGMETVLCNLVEPGDKVLVLVNGIWGKRAADIAQRYRATVQTVHNKDLGKNFSLIEIENAVSKFKPKVLFVVQGESSTGVYQPLEGIGEITKRYKCLLAVDTVASLGAVPLQMDAWKIDAIYTGSQKIIGVPPGLTPLSFSERAQKAIFERKSKIQVYFWDIKLLGQQWKCFEEDLPRIYHHTTCANLLYALREGLAVIIEEGLENVIQRHEQCAQQLYKGVVEMGLELFVEDEEKRLPSVTTIKVPPNVIWTDVVGFAMKNYHLEISGGLGPTAGKVWRIGIMGFNATTKNISFTLSVLKEALEHCNKKISKL